MKMFFFSFLCVESACTRYGCPVDGGTHSSENFKPKPSWQPKIYQKSIPPLIRKNTGNQYIAIPLKNHELLFIINDQGYHRTTKDQIIMQRPGQTLHIFDLTSKSFRPAIPYQLPQGFYAFTTQNCPACKRLKLMAEKRGIRLKPLYIKSNGNEKKAYTSLWANEKTDATIWLKLYEKQFKTQIRYTPVPFSVDANGQITPWEKNDDPSGAGFKIPSLF